METITTMAEILWIMKYHLLLAGTMMFVLPRLSKVWAR